jgi:murein DD-endopeptidase MepM/ murein hydrolase activator NlpD
MHRPFVDSPGASPLFVRIAVPLVVLCFAAPAAAASVERSQIVAIGLALRSGGFYAGSPLRAGAHGDRRHRRNVLGRATLRLGKDGWAVRELQLALAWQGFPSGTIDGRFGPRLEDAVRRFQHAAGLRVDGVAGGATIASLRTAPRRPVVPLGWPLLAPVGDVFGPRGSRFHAGVDLLAPAGTPVTAAAAGRVTWAGRRAGGWGKLVTVASADGVRTMYAHLSTIRVRVGDWIAGGTMIGRVGSTGDATGPHLHFEVRVNGAAVNPLRALVMIPASERTLSARR